MPMNMNVLQLMKYLRREESQWFYSTALCETKHVKAGVVPGATKPPAVTEENKSTESLESRCIFLLKSHFIILTKIIS
jgi:hypothetical protein